MEKFKIEIDDAVLEDLKLRIHNTRYPLLERRDWDRGLNSNYLSNVIDYWINDYDWRKHEAKLNAFDHYKTRIGDDTIHFIFQKGKGKKPYPLLLTHGWPDSFLRYIKVITPLTMPFHAHDHQMYDCFDVIVPSIPGFGFSSAPLDHVYNNEETSHIWHKLMTEVLGYEKFMVSGGDMGSGISRYLAVNYPQNVTALHLTDVGIIKSVLMQDDVNLSEALKAYKHTASKWMNEEAGYIAIQSTKPATLAYGLSDSPVGLAAWILEKAYSWSDLNSQMDLDDIITNIMIYWVTNSISKSITAYYENLQGLPPLDSIDTPTGVTLFKHDILLPPLEWLEENLNLKFMNLTEMGGHFTALESPDEFISDIRLLSREIQ